jgi:hypothetical protein
MLTGAETVGCQLLLKAGDARNASDNVQSKYEHPKTSLNNRHVCVIYTLYGLSNNGATYMFEKPGRLRLVERLN